MPGRVVSDPLDSLHRPIGPIHDVKNEEREGKSVHENVVHFRKQLSLVEGGDLFLALVELRTLVQEAVFGVNHSQAFPLFHHGEPFLHL